MCCSRCKCMLLLNKPTRIFPFQHNFVVFEVRTSQHQYTVIRILTNCVQTQKRDFQLLHRPFYVSTLVFSPYMSQLAHASILFFLRRRKKTVCEFQKATTNQIKFSSVFFARLIENEPLCKYVRLPIVANTILCCDTKLTAKYGNLSVRHDKNCQIYRGKKNERQPIPTVFLPSFCSRADFVSGKNLANFFGKKMFLSLLV